MTLKCLCEHTRNCLRKLNQFRQYVVTVNTHVNTLNQGDNFTLKVVTYVQR
ncbi:hypothetical protein Patl1_15915 [Pistacia atlantica]|uniref:Uncharacterized protein n=1 Tax=Pistacia atlantica TaxID=434234 RepID=A0ACC1B7N1_9ROSI|nr:hypothetical protein Patl1_15915 [Pistacia atlantica]